MSFGRAFKLRKSFYHSVTSKWLSVKFANIYRFIAKQNTINKSLLYSVYLVLENEELTTTIITDAETLVWRKYFDANLAQN